jgi:hypothetical protein
MLILQPFRAAQPTTVLNRDPRPPHSIPFRFTRNSSPFLILQRSTSTSTSKTSSMQTGRGHGLLSPTVGPTDPYAEANVYYGGQTDASVNRSVHRTRTLSSVVPSSIATEIKAGLAADFQQVAATRSTDKGRLRRRASHGTTQTGSANNQVLT